ncbi:MAG: tyrosine-type recombinase/integrase [Armatimonadota bacterium]
MAADTALATTETAIAANLRADNHPAAVYIMSLAPGSRRTMKEALDTIAGILTSGRDDAVSLNWAGLRYQHTAAIREELAAKYAPATANKMLSALRGVLKESWRLGLMTAEDFQRAADLRAVRGEKLPSGRALSHGEVRALFEACGKDTSAAGARDAALLAVLYGAGVRRSEAAALKLEDFDQETGAIVIRAGKGRKDRMVYATNGSREALLAWLELRGDTPGTLFCPVNKGGNITIRPMTDQSIFYVLKKRGEEAEVKGFSPHDMRRTFIGELLDAGADISTVQQLAGHANVTTTQRYDRRGEATKRKAAELLHVPYTRAS